MSTPVDPQPVTINDFALSYRAKTYGQPAMLTTPWGTPAFKTRQECYRFAAWLLSMAELLPQEDLASSYEEVKAAIENT